jgi:hypothetical protein
MCSDCMAARETSGNWRFYDPRCLWCGARCIQRIPKFCETNAEASQRRKIVLRDWMAMGHAEKEIRELVAGPMAFEPIKKGK